MSPVHLVATPPPQTPDRLIEDLRLSANAAQLAVAQYYFEMTYWRGKEAVAPPLWAALSGEEKQRRIEEAAEWLKDHEPAKCAYGCGRYVEIGSDYCGAQCRIDAENDR